MSTFSLFLSVLTTELMQGSSAGVPVTTKKDLHLDVEVAAKQGPHLEMRAYWNPMGYYTGSTLCPSLETLGSSTLLYNHVLQ